MSRERPLADKIVLRGGMVTIAVLGLWGASKLGLFEDSGGNQPEPTPTATASVGPAGFSCERLEVERATGGVVTAVTEGKVPDAATLVVDVIAQNARMNKDDVRVEGELAVDVGRVPGISRIDAGIHIGNTIVPCPPLLFP